MPATDKLATCWSLVRRRHSSRRSFYGYDGYTYTRYKLGCGKKPLVLHETLGRKAAKRCAVPNETTAPRTAAVRLHGGRWRTAHRQTQPRKMTHLHDVLGHVNLVGAQEVQHVHAGVVARKRQHGDVKVDAQLVERERERVSVREQTRRRDMYVGNQVKNSNISTVLVSS